MPLLSAEEEADAGWGEGPSADFEGDRLDAEGAIETACNALSDACKRSLMGMCLKTDQLPW